MNVLIIGSGGREHVLAWKLSQSKLLAKLYCAPGSTAISEIAECVDIDIKKFNLIAKFCKEKKIDTVVVGPEAPLAGGIADFLSAYNVDVFGPSKSATKLESSKVFAKHFMMRHNIPTAKFNVLADAKSAFSEIEELSLPVVLKADGLAGGKGVKICKTASDAEKTITDYMKNKIFGNAGTTIVAEEFLRGKEVSVMAVCDGKNYVLLPTSRDHKPLLDGNEGPNTGGMGAYSNPTDLTKSVMQEVKTKIFDRLIKGLQKENIPYCGVIYAGLMLTDDGPKVIEFNCRFGDPETQVILPLLRSDLLELISACFSKKLKNFELETCYGECVCVVLASKGYPSSPVKGVKISGIEDAHQMNNIEVFHSGTKKEDGNWVTSGGRVLGITALADDVESARINAYKAVSKIKFDGMQYRKDIASDASQKCNCGKS
ncbi:MAG TPA: phosphoribosylamine--glycine ligase [Elusimicrobiales bacterium]|nr:phosphoribosylamine--glycine ligase [Elusimicrobiales bacterium]